MRRILPAVLCFLLATVFYGRIAHAACPADWLEFDTESRDGSVLFTGRNLSNAPITFTMNFKLRGLSASRRTTFTETLQPKQAKPLVTLRRKNPNRSGRYEYDFRCTVGNKDADHNDDVLYLLPYAKGKSYRVLQGFGSRFSHTGIETYAVDFNMREGTPVHAARGGIVAQVEESHSIGCWKPGCGKYANYIVIIHDDDTTGEYYHLQQNGALVELGQHVEAGQLIGLSGDTGHSTTPHLHFAVYRAGTWGRDHSIPVRFLSQSGIINRPRSGGRYLATSHRRVSRLEDTAFTGGNKHLE